MKRTCGIVMPIREVEGYKKNHFQAIRQMITDAAKASTSFEFVVDMVSSVEHIANIQKNIVQNLATNDIVVVDLSSKNPNVLFELGMRLTFDKPTVIIQDDTESFEFDFGNVEHLIYPKEYDYESIQAFKVQLTQKIDATLKLADDKGENFSQYLKQYGEYSLNTVPNIELDSFPDALSKIMDRLDTISAQVDFLDIQDNANNNVENFNVLTEDDKFLTVTETLRDAITSEIKNKKINNKISLIKTVVHPTSSRNFRADLTFQNLTDNNVYVTTETFNIPFARPQIEHLVLAAFKHI